MPERARLGRVARPSQGKRIEEEELPSCATRHRARDSIAAWTLVRDGGHRAPVRGERPHRQGMRGSIISVVNRGDETIRKITGFLQLLW